MEKRDARKLNTQAQEELRKQSLKMVERGLTHQAVADLVEVSRTTITKWCKLYKSGGMKALEIGQRGRRFGEKKTLTAKQESQIKKILKDKTPDQLKLPFALWSRRLVMELIHRKTDILMPIRTVGEYLKSWGFTPQRPVKRAYEQQPKVIQEWLDKTYPSIEIQAKKEKAVIHWGDETGFSSEDNRGRGYAPSGKTPVVNTPAKRFSTSMISTVTNRGKLRFMVYHGGLNIDIFLDFLRRLIRCEEQKIFLIVDNLRVHHAKLVKKWAKKNRNKIELFYLPSYSPEHNPDEYVNQDVKSAMRKKTAPRSQKELEKSLHGYMRGLQRKSHKVAKFFDHEKVQYAK